MNPYWRMQYYGKSIMQNRGSSPDGAKITLDFDKTEAKVQHFQGFLTLRESFPLNALHFCLKRRCRAFVCLNRLDKNNAWLEHESV